MMHNDLHNDLHWDVPEQVPRKITLKKPQWITTSFIGSQGGNVPYAISK